MDLSHERVSESRGRYRKLDLARLPPGAAGHGKPFFFGENSGYSPSSRDDRFVFSFSHHSLRVTVSLE